MVKLFFFIQYTAFTLHLSLGLNFPSTHPGNSVRQTADQAILPVTPPQAQTSQFIRYTTPFTKMIRSYNAWPWVAGRQALRHSVTVRLNVRMGKTSDLNDSVQGEPDPVYQTRPPSWAFHTRQCLGLTENGATNKD